MMSFTRCSPLLSVTQGGLGLLKLTCLDYIMKRTLETRAALLPPADLFTSTSQLVKADSPCTTMLGLHPRETGGVLLGEAGGRENELFVRKMGYYRNIYEEQNICLCMLVELLYFPSLIKGLEKTRRI